MAMLLRSGRWMQI